MKHTSIKKVITAKGQTQYYLGDGFWFGRIKKDKALKGIEEGKYFLFDTIDHRIEEAPEVHNPISTTVH